MSLYRLLVIVAFTGALCLGVMMTFAIPPFQVPDENAHWGVAYQRTENLFSLGRPDEAKQCSVAEALPEHFECSKVAFHPGRQMRHGLYERLPRVKEACGPAEIPYGTVFTYPGVVAARAIVPLENLHPDKALLSFYLARLLHGLFYFGLLFRFCYVAFRQASIPFGTLTLVAFSISPLFLQQLFAISADPICQYLVVVLGLWLCFWRSMGRFDALLLFTVGITAIMTKSPLFPLVPLCLLLGWWRESARERSWRSLRVIAAITTSAVSLLAAVYVTLKASAGENTQLPTHDISASRQVSHILANPLSTLLMTHDTFVDRTGLEQFTHPLGWLDTGLSLQTQHNWQGLLNWGLLCELGLLVTMVVKRRLDNERLRREAFLMAICLIGIYAGALLSCLTLYIVWTPVGATSIMGVQSRYLFPFILLTIIAVGSALTRSLRPSEPLASGEPAYMPSVRAFFASALVLWMAFYGASLWLDLARRYW